MYHVALELTQEQVKQLRLQAVAKNQTVKSFIAELVKAAIREDTIQIRKEEKKK